MKTMLAAALICASVLCASFVGGQEQPARPPHVMPHDWIALGDAFGFAITPGATTPDSDVLIGHFFALHEGVWKQVDDEGGFRIQPLRK